MLPKSYVDSYIEAHEVIGAAAKETLKRYYELGAKYGDGYSKERLKVLHHLHFVGISDGELDFEGDEYWSHGGYQQHSACLVISYLYDPTVWLWKEEQLQQLQQEREENERKKAKEALRRKEAFELAEYERLKAKFECATGE